MFVAAGNRDDFAAHYGASIASKFDVVSNGCDPAEFDALRGTVAPAPDGPFVLLHAGSLYAGRTPVPLLNAVARAIAGGRIQRDRFRLRFLGVNALKGVDLAGTCQALGLGDVVEFLPRVKSRREPARDDERVRHCCCCSRATRCRSPGRSTSTWPPGGRSSRSAKGKPPTSSGEAAPGRV